MNIWLKRSLISLGVFAACWLGAVWYWRATTRLPDTGDLALGLIGAPVAMLAALWAAARAAAMAGVSAGRNTVTVTAPDGTAGEAADAAASAAATPSASRLAILSAALRMPHGSSPGELAAAFSSGSASLGLDPELTDAQGFPLLAGRVQDTDTAAVSAWLAGQPPHTPGLHQLRALALGGAVAAQLSHAARTLAGALHAEAGIGKLHMTFLLPTDWDAPARELAAGWLMHTALAAGWSASQLSLRSAGDGGAFAALDGIAQRAATLPAHDLELLLAMDSSISDAAVTRLAAQGRLFGQRRQHGLVPGEGAAGLLLQRAAELPEAVHLLGLQSGAPGTLTELAKATLAAGKGLGDSAIVHASADTGHRSAAMMELMQCTGEVAPGLDHASQLSCIGAACGHTGEAGALAAIALAWHHAAESEGYALCLGNNHAEQRHALVLGPAPAPSLI